MSADLNAGLPDLFAPSPSGPPALSTAHLERAYAWAQTEIGEWLAEADEEAAAIVDRARAEALRLELAGYEELERLREEAVRVRMATAERVARRLGDARTEADQVLANAGAEAGMIMERARRVVLDLLDDVQALQAETAEGSRRGDAGAEAFSSAAARLEALLQPAMTTAPGRPAAGPPAGRPLARIPWGGSLADRIATDQIVMDDSDPRVPPTAAPARPAWPGTASGAVRRPPVALPPLALGPPTVKYFPDDVVTDRPARPGWRQRLSRLIHPA